MSQFDVAIIGGGLAGLVNAIQLSQNGLQVAVFEKYAYPFHRVCGEYISNETLPFLQKIGFNPFEYGAIPLTQFQLTSPKGSQLNLPLDLGGFGLSRYKMDNALFEIAQQNGATFFQNTQVNGITFSENFSQNKAIIHTEKNGDFEAKIVIGTYGKRSNLDSQLDRKFFKQRSPYIGVKYHIQTHLQPNDLISLHNFSNGYCGISRIEDEKFCLCYLTTRENLRKYQTIENLENQLLHQNPFLKNIWKDAVFLFDKPKVINEISFAPKPLTEGKIWMCGDTAGMIAPLCGNGMAMAIHSAKILSSLLIRFFDKQLDEPSLLRIYQKEWSKHFAQRLWIGRNVQKFFGHPLMTEMLLQTARLIRPFGKMLVKQSHGQVF